MQLRRSAPNSRFENWQEEFRDREQDYRGREPD